MPHFILVHGAYNGSWSWEKVAKFLEQNKALVLTPALTGLGEKSNLITINTNLSTHISDIVNLLKNKNLNDIILVGHSYAGMVITGVADTIPERISHLIYLDALVPLNGQSVLDILPSTKLRAIEAEIKGQRLKIITPPPPQTFGIHNPEDISRVIQLLTPMPYACYSEPIKFTNSNLSNIHKTYLMCELQPGGELQKAHEVAFHRAQGNNWDREIIQGPHAIMITHPKECAEILLRLAK